MLNDCPGAEVADARTSPRASGRGSRVDLMTTSYQARAKGLMAGLRRRRARRVGRGEGGEDTPAPPPVQFAGVADLGSRRPGLKSAARSADHEVMTVRPRARLSLLALLIGSLASPAEAVVFVSVDPAQDRRAVDPRIYGVNYGSAAGRARLPYPL